MGAAAREVWLAPDSESGRYASLRFMMAGEAAGLGVTEDYNGARNEGICRLQWTIRNGKRCSATVAYLRPALTRGNLAIEVGAYANKIVIEGKRAVAIAYEKGGENHVARASREVILAGGSINSPQLLMLSGIGDPDELRSHGIEVRAPLPGVGAAGVAVTRTLQAAGGRQAAQKGVKSFV